MAETMTLIDSTISVTQKPISHENVGDESAEPLAPADKSPFRRIEFHLARKPFTGFTNGGGDGSFRLETLNPPTTSSKVTNTIQESSAGGASGRKRDAPEMENGLDPELSFGITFRRIGAGLENLGNTCFLNSVLQCLTYTEPLAAYLQSGKHQVACRKSGFCALCAIQKHVSRALQLSGRSLAPKDLVSNLRCISRTFRNSRQEDAHEYMVNLLESMHKCCLPNGVPSESQSAYDRSLVHKIFGGRLRSQVKCMQCNYCSNKFDPFLDLSLEILRADTLYKAFANFTAKEQLDGGAKQYQCQQCKQKVKALKQLTIHKPPNVLTIHLKRFGSHMSGQKIDKKIQFGPTLDLKPFVTGPYDGDLKYTLYGVLVHAGWSTHSGHYYCFVRTSSGMWYSLDDNRVYQVSEKKVFEQKAYMLFYFKDRKTFPTKKNMDVHQKEKIVMNGIPNVPGASRELQMNTDVHQNENIVMNGTPSGPGAPKESQSNTDVLLKEKIVINGTPNGPGASRESQMNTDVHLKDKNGMNGAPNVTSASREAQMKTCLSNGSSNAQTSLANFGTERNGSSPVAPKEILINNISSDLPLNGHKSSVPVCTQVNGPSAPKETQMKTGQNNGSSNGKMSMAVVGADRNDFSLVAPKKTQTESTLSNGSLDGEKSSDAVETMRNGFSTGAREATQKKQASVPKRISEPGKTENHTEEIGGGESSGGNRGDDSHVEKDLGGRTNVTELSDLSKIENCMEKSLVGKILEIDSSDVPKMEDSLEKKALGGKKNKKVKNALKCKIVPMKFSKNVLMRTSLLNQRKKIKHKRNKHIKNLGQENLVNEGPSSSVETKAHDMVKSHIENGLKERVNKDGAVLVTSNLNGDSTGSQTNRKESNRLEQFSKSLAQKDLVHMLTIGTDDRTFPRWDEDASAPQKFRGNTKDLTIGYVGDEWDQEYDRGKRKKVRISKTEFDGKNPFQEIANERLKSHLGKQNLSKRPPMIKRKNKHFKNGNGPYRIGC